jgi:hypothetical protein
MRHIKRYLISVLLLVFASASLVGQDGAEEGRGAAGEDRQTPPEYDPLPNGFREIRLGMSLEDVKQELKRDGYFYYRGDPDVSLLTQPNRTVIETEGVTFIKKAFFQFFEKALYIIILRINEDNLDYYTLYTTLKEKYGPSDDLDPSQVVWENDRVRISLERPLQVKYIDVDVFNSLTKEQKADESMENILRRKFLQEF